MKTFNNGDRIQWTYEHHLNSRSSVMITKRGVFLEVTGAVKNVRYVSGTHAKVKFDGNKTVSKVLYNELEHEEKKRKRNVK